MPVPSLHSTPGFGGADLPAWRHEWIVTTISPGCCQNHPLAPCPARCATIALAMRRFDGDGEPAAAARPGPAATARALVEPADADWRSRFRAARGRDRDPPRIADAGRGAVDPPPAPACDRADSDDGTRSAQGCNSQAQHQPGTARVLAPALLSRPACRRQARAGTRAGGAGGASATCPRATLCRPRQPGPRRPRTRAFLPRRPSRRWRPPSLNQHPANRSSSPATGTPRAPQYPRLQSPWSAEPIRRSWS